MVNSKTTAIFYNGAFLYLLLITLTVTCTKVPTPVPPFEFEQLSRDDFEIVSGGFKGVDETDRYYFELLKLKKTDTPYKKRLIAFLDSVLYDGMTIEKHLEREKKVAAKMEHEDFRDRMGTWYINGKYLCIERTYYACAAGCNGRTPLYVIDTHLLKLLTLDDIFINPNSQAFEKLIMRYVSDGGECDAECADEIINENEVESVAEDAVENDDVAEFGEFGRSLKERRYEISYEYDGIGFHWDKYVGELIGSDIVIPRTKIEPYMTPAGKESSKLEVPPLQKIYEDVVKMAGDGTLHKYSSDRYEARYKTYLRIYPLSDTNLVIYNDIGYYLEQAHAYEAAIYLLQAIIDKYPKRVVAYLNIADAYWGTYKQEDAIKNYEAYVRLMKSQKKDMSKIPQRVYDRLNPTALDSIP